ncbi:hypothetical protein TeGR_g12079 [Tetraparma gracilis]|uniref:protein-disulfide reductase n=1 Tax=Tetraparma gracilis TaxID=2962635 RepID=A0ABQ6N3N2_9STRA|nr:hypothetical protein TeGR_g12079 [Tetraparma gracilis]
MSAFSGFSELFGPTLASSATSTVPTSTLSGKHILVYFSAHWCPPCRGFTPKLCEFVSALRKTNPNFECVFVSSDKDQAEFDGYFETMPFLALPYADRERKNALSKRFKVGGIPSLLVLAPDGSVVTDDGRSGVMEDPSGAGFPWTPPTFADVFPATLASKAGPVLSSSLDSKHLMLYFSASWCGPCQSFTPELVKVYEEIGKSRDDAELVFVSSDEDEAEFEK